MVRSAVEWLIEYFEQTDGLQPAGAFEDEIDRTLPKLGGRLLRLLDEIETKGQHVGGGYLEPCHDYPGLWEIRARHQQWLGREFLGFDGKRAILLHGYVKRQGKPAARREFMKARSYWKEYLESRRTSPEQEDHNESI
jgi:hypothetical protein